MKSAKLPQTVKTLSDGKCPWRDRPKLLLQWLWHNTIFLKNRVLITGKRAFLTQALYIGIYFIDLLISYIDW